MKSDSANIVIYALGSLGDFLPMLDLSAALRRKGFNVYLLGNEIHKELAESKNIHFFSVSSSKDYYASYTTGRVSPLGVRSHLVNYHIPAYTRSYEVVDSLCSRLKINLIIGLETINGCVWGAAKHNISYIKISLTPHSSKKLQLIEARSTGVENILKFCVFLIVKRILTYFTIYLPYSSPLQKKLGLSSGLISSYIKSQKKEIALFPRWFTCVSEKHMPDMVFFGFPCSNMVVKEARSSFDDAWKDRSRPLLVFTFGSLILNFEKELKKINSVCEKIGATGLVVLSGRNKNNYKNFINLIITGYVDFEYVLPHASLLVSVGGIGASTQALKHGVKQIVMPLVFDQMDNARRLAELGLAKVISVLSDTDNLVNTIRSVLYDQKYEEALGFLKEKMREVCAIENCAQYIEQMIIKEYLHLEIGINFSKGNKDD